MQLMTFTEILTKLCDTFDDLIAPKTIARRNTNVIYLIFKAIAKGYEIINNVCVTLSHKFDPLTCSTEDLESVASLVGTERFKGSASGLHIVVTNENEADAKTLAIGTYTYKLDDDVSFSFDIIEPVVIEAGLFADFIAMSDKIGRFEVTEQGDITVDTTAPQGIPSGLAFSCKDNTALLGNYAESDLEFRNRINTDTTRQSGIVELETTLRNLPYIFDARLKYNDTDEPVTFDGYTLNPSVLAIFFSGELKNEIAEVVAGKIICPTLETEDSQTVYYENAVFTSGNHAVHLIPFGKTEYKIKVIYKIDTTLADDYGTKNKIKAFLHTKLLAEKHIDFIKEDDIYNLLEQLDLIGVNILGVNLIQNDAEIDYLEIPLTRIPVLLDVDFVKEN